MRGAVATKKISLIIPVAFLYCKNTYSSVYLHLHCENPIVRGMSRNPCTREVCLVHVWDETETADVSAQLQTDCILSCQLSHERIFTLG